MIRKTVLAALLLASCGRSEAPPDLQVSNAWARATVAGQTSTAAYMTIANAGGDDRLVGAAVPAPARASLHATSHAGGVASLRPLEDGLPVPAGATISLEPGGAHLMIEGLEAPLRPGDAVPIRLRFERAGERTIQAPVAAAAPQGS